MTVHRIADEPAPIGRPAFVREAALYQIRKMQRATVDRLAEETGFAVGSIRPAMRRLYEMGEVTRELKAAGHLRFYVYEVRQ